MSDIISEIEAIVRGRVDEYLIQVVDSKELMIKMANGEVSTTQSWSDYSISIYVARSKRIAASTYTTMDPREAIRNTVMLLDRLEESPLYAELPSPDGVVLNSVDNRLKEIAYSGNALDVVEELQLSEHTSAAGMIKIAYWTRRLVGSNGADYTQEGTSFNGYIRIFKDNVSGQWAWTDTRYNRGKALASIEQASILAEECSRLPRMDPEPGEYRILLSPMIAANLLHHVASAASAGAIILGFSFLRNYGLGKKVGSELVSIRERPRDTTLPLFSGFDDEGVATRDKEIFSGGVFKTVLHNSKTARMFGDKTTGNAGWILPRLFNIEVAPGDLGSDELLEALGDGIYVTNNWYTRFQNYVEGLFSTVSRDALFIVRGGKPVACSDRVRLSGRLPEMLARISGLSRDQYDIQWWEVDDPVRTPFVIVDGMKVTKPMQ